MLGLGLSVHKQVFPNTSGTTLWCVGGQDSYMGAYLVYDGGITSDERALVLDYLTTKYL